MIVSPNAAVRFPYHHSARCSRFIAADPTNICFFMIECSIRKNLEKRAQPWLPVYTSNQTNMPRGYRYTAIVVLGHEWST